LTTEKFEKILFLERTSDACWGFPPSSPRRGEVPLIIRGPDSGKTVEALSLYAVINAFVFISYFTFSEGLGRDLLHRSSPPPFLHRSPPLRPPQGSPAPPRIFVIFSSPLFFFFFLPITSCPDFSQRLESPSCTTSKVNRPSPPPPRNVTPFSYWEGSLRSSDLALFAVLASFRSPLYGVLSRYLLLRNMTFSFPFHCDPPFFPRFEGPFSGDKHSLFFWLLCLGPSGDFPPRTGLFLFFFPLPWPSEAP